VVSGRTKSIAFLCFDTAFFVRHFRPAVVAARASGFSVTAVLPTLPEQRVDFLDEAEIIPIKSGRRRRPGLSLLSNLTAVLSAFRQCRPDVVHAFTLHGCFILAIASRLISIPHRIYAITGLGLLEADTRWPNRILRPLVYWWLRQDDSESSVFVFENLADPQSMGFRPGHPKRSLTLMGAGVDIETFAPQPLPPLPPLKVAVVARMIWTKGVDLAVEAVSRLIADGVAVELDIYGAPDFANQRYVPIRELEAWGRRPGIHWHGFVFDISKVWESHHVGIFPSRGGEGLPRAMLEASACGRPLITTAVAGCTDFVRPDVEGFLVTPNSVEELTEAISRLINHPELIEPMGQAGRTRVTMNATLQIITDRYRALYSQLQKD
jgi:glycosyltransferase involved in cell wall biosynthesis